jgi:predicted transcriptional regulator
LKEEQLKILQIMVQATNRMDLNMFAEKINLNPEQTIHQVQELASKGLLRKVGSGYGVTEKGKSAIKAYAQLPDGFEFNFYMQIDQPTGQTAKTIADFYQIIKQVNVVPLEFHLYRGDFENWVKSALNDADLVKQIADIEGLSLKGEVLRGELLKVIDEKYAIKDLL